MGNGMDKIVSGLYLGNCRDSKDMEQLTENRISHIVAIHDNAQPLFEQLTYKCIQAADSPDQNLLPFFQECIDFIHECRINGGHCLVHCIAGVSRSTTIVAAYIMTVTNLTWRETLQAIRATRSVANPNYGFKRQLQDFYNKDLQQEKERLKRNYPDLNFNGEEQQYLESLLPKDEDGSREDDDIPDVLNLYENRSKELREKRNNFNETNATEDSGEQSSQSSAEN